MTACRAQGSRVSLNTCLLGQVFFISSTAFKPDQVRSTILLLGGRVDLFFSKDVTSLIVDDCCVSEFQSVEYWRPNGLVPIKSRRGNAVAKFNRSKSFHESQMYILPCTSAGYPFIDPYRTKPEAYINESVLRLMQRARQWGISVIGVRQFMAFVEKKMQPTFDNPRKLKPCAQAIRLAGCFIKVEDIASAYRTFYKVFADDPVKNLPWEFKNFLSKGLTFSKHLPCNNFLKNTAVKNKLLAQEPNSKPKKGTDNYKVTPKSKKKQNLFCECCNSYFSDVHQHILGEKHQNYANVDANYDCVREIVKTLPTIETFLLNHNSSLDFLSFETTVGHPPSHPEAEFSVQNPLDSSCLKMPTPESLKCDIDALFPKPEGMCSVAYPDSPICLTVSNKCLEVEKKVQNCSNTIADEKLFLDNLSTNNAMQVPCDEPINFDFEDDWFDALCTEIKKDNVDETFKEFAEHCQKLLSETANLWGDEEEEQNQGGNIRDNVFPAVQTDVSCAKSEPNLKRADSSRRNDLDEVAFVQDETADKTVKKESLDFNDNCKQLCSSSLRAKNKTESVSLTSSQEICVVDDSSDCNPKDAVAICSRYSESISVFNESNTNPVAVPKNCAAKLSQMPCNKTDTKYSECDMELDSNCDNNNELPEILVWDSNMPPAPSAASTAVQNFVVKEEVCQEVAICSDKEGRADVFKSNINGVLNPNEVQKVPKLIIQNVENHQRNDVFRVGVIKTAYRFDDSNLLPPNVGKENPYQFVELGDVSNSGSFPNASFNSRLPIAIGNIKLERDETLETRNSGQLRFDGCKYPSSFPAAGSPVDSMHCDDARSDRKVGIIIPSTNDGNGAANQNLPEPFLSGMPAKKTAQNHQYDTSRERMFSSDDSDGGIRCDDLIGDVLTIINESPVKIGSAGLSIPPDSHLKQQEIVSNSKDTTNQPRKKRRRRRRVSGEWSVCIIPSKSIKLKFTRNVNISRADFFTGTVDGFDADQSSDGSQDGCT